MQIATLLTLLPLLAAAQPTARDKGGKDVFKYHETKPILSPEASAALKTTPIEVLANLGPYSPFLSAESTISRDLPKGMQVDQVQIVSRHGARNPTANALKKLKKTISQLSSAKTSDPKLKFIETWTYPEVEADALTDFGRHEVYNAGARYAKQYASLGKETFVRADESARVVESASFFLQGWNGDAFSTTAPKALPDVIQMGKNMTLDIGTCDTYENQEVDPSEVAEENWTATFGPAIVKRLNAALGTNLTIADETVTALISLCAFDSIKGAEWVESPWCKVWTNDEMRQNEYWYDLSKFYNNGWGTPYSRVLGTGLANEVIARLTGKPLLQGSGTNSTHPLPLDRKVYADFSHDNNMVSLLPALGLNWESPLPTKPNPAAIPPHKFVVSSQVPFSGRIVFERLADKKGKKYVRVLVNDAVLPLTLPGCGKEGIEDGYCSLDAFVAAQSFAQQVPSVWDQMCYGPLINTTIAL